MFYLDLAKSTSVKMNIKRQEMFEKVIDSPKKDEDDDQRVLKLRTYREIKNE